ncbi:hypothetical protein [Clostridium sp. DJ247]|uniref:DUF7668 domain-containing protein n=1 Tax=Clostridium sp. DJ247 TaxID=2726188 RepID=UPI00162597B8|nr:hypothetical protein [Clostridium sp. DJ247]MBC2582756.1 hypothetical protein [Clostridium sp. DJ247]
MGKISVATASDIKERIEEYLIDDEKLTMPPNEFIENNIDIFEIEYPKNFKKEFKADINLWVDDEKSDLTLSCEAVVDIDEKVNVSIYDVRVF